MNKTAIFRNRISTSFFIGLLITGVLVSFVLTGCVTSPSESRNSTERMDESASPSSRSEVDYQNRPLIRLATLKGPTGMGMAKLLTDHDQQLTYNRYETTIVGAPDTIIAKITTGEIDIAAVPTNLAATLYNKTDGQVQLLAVNTLGVLHILEKGNTVSTVDDLKGKTLYATGKGSIPEYILNYLLIQNEIDPINDLTIEYKTEHTELATLALSGKADLIMLPEPFVTTVLSNNAGFREAIDLTVEWGNTMDKLGLKRSVLSMGCVIVRKDFAENNESAVNDFLTEYEASINYLLENQTEASEMIAAQGIMPSASLAKMAIPGSNIIFIEGEIMKNQILNLYNVLFLADPKSIGGALPGDDFYYIR